MIELYECEDCLGLYQLEEDHPCMGGVKLGTTSQKVKNEINNQCFYCGSKPRTLTRDHVIPKAESPPGGPWNLVKACFPCNVSKGHKPVGVWLRRIGHRKKPPHKEREIHRRRYRIVLALSSRPEMRARWKQIDPEGYLDRLLREAG